MNIFLQIDDTAAVYTNFLRFHKHSYNHNDQEFPDFFITRERGEFLVKHEVFWFFWLILFWFDFLIKKSKNRRRIEKCSFKTK